MIILHRKREGKASDQLEEQLNSLVISYKKVSYEKEEEQKNLPFIEEDGREFHTDEEISGWLRELESELSWQRSLSGDGCYVDPGTGKVC
ncbi:hypothetical protein [Gracilimonas sp. BCB1]|uniref:hypothetical protein n=1 Tax=Gracilimonas sp. BCB1 TaxID=3152362 RepID=UPI0032D93B9F